MPKSASFCLALLLALPLTSTADQPHHPARPHPQSRLTEAAAITAEKGFDAKLPPHISTLLRLTTEQECPVKQSVTRSSNLVQGLDVSVANKNDVILFVVDETTHDQSLYLTGPDGALRRVVKIVKGVGSEVRISDKDRQDFQKEKQYWIDRLVPASKGK
ncbi:hypothetical protein DYQ86_10830 [Acidobacteria bacterium AB60]|nr:hypothetical protein DYQ86_10830 [Acidobacteria bacterium AB60]